MSFVVKLQVTERVKILKTKFFVSIFFVWIVFTCIDVHCIKASCTRDAEKATFLVIQVFLFTDLNAGHCFSGPVHTGAKTCNAYRSVKNKVCVGQYFYMYVQIRAYMCIHHPPLFKKKS